MAPLTSSFDLPAGTDFSGKKILIIVENLPVPFDRRVWQEATTLRAAGAEVSIICPVGKNFTAEYELLEGIHIYRHKLPAEVDSSGGYLREYASALFAEFRLACRIFVKHGFDVIHGCNPPDLIFLVALPFKLLGRKFVFDHHDINPELYEAKFNRRDFFWRLLLLMERATFFFADTVICTNESYRAIAMTRGKKNKSDTFVVRSGPDLRRVQPMSADPRWKNGRAFLVGYVGVIGDQEGIDLLLETVRHLVEDQGRKDIQFAIAGGGPALDKLKTMATDLRLDDYVSFLGRVSDADLFSMLSTADVCVNPDRVNPMNNLSTMNKILEYMAMGKPIVQYDVVEGRVSAQEASLYAKPNDTRDFADKIVEFLDDPEKSAHAGAIGRQRVVAELSWAHQIPQLFAAYKHVFGLGAATAVHAGAQRAATPVGDKSA